MIDDLKNSISKIAQGHFYFISLNIARSIWLSNLDKTGPKKSTFKFSMERNEPSFDIGRFETLFLRDTVFKAENLPDYNKSVGDHLRIGSQTFIRMSLVLLVQSILDYYLEKNNFNFLKKPHFTFFRDVGNAIKHSQGRWTSRSTKDVKVINLPNGVSMSNEDGIQLTISDKKLHELLSLVERDILLELKNKTEEPDVITSELLSVINDH